MKTELTVFLDPARFEKIRTVAEEREVIPDDLANRLLNVAIDSVSPSDLRELVLRTQSPRRSLINIIRRNQ